MLEDDEEVAALYHAWCDDLRATFDEVEPWWQELRARESASALRERWPAGVASHPRVLGAYVEHHRRCERLLAKRRGAPVVAVSFTDDDAWGVAAEPEPRTLLPFVPQQLLIDRLQVEEPALFQKMIHLVLSPVGRGLDPTPSLEGLGMATRSAAAGIMGAAPPKVRSFQLELRHGVDRGVARLLAAAADLAPGAPQSTVRSSSSEAHAMAHFLYHRALEEALSEAELWWTRLLFAAEDRGLSPEEAREHGYRQHFCGPASHPAVIGVIAGYWALCEEINGALAPEQYVAPAQLLLGWLLDERHESWVAMLSAMPYWPVARDREGRWIA
ncbi:MAG: hypothetical protein KC457_23505 [Myxococcales bacterium]|nr:hypothetical protein [Myxococcales bacterium]